MRNVFIAACVSIAVATVPTVTLATSYTVTTTDDELDGSPSCVTGSSTDCSLREAITLANADTSGDHTIILGEAEYQSSISTVSMSISTDNDDNDDGDFDITNTTSKITIMGAGVDQTIVDGGATGDISSLEERIFEVLPGANLQLKYLRLVNGDASATGSVNGGAIYTAGTLALDNVYVGFNTTGTNGNGGGIYVASTGVANIQDSNIFSNTSLSHGGGIYATGITTIVDSEINTNQATSSTAFFLRAGGIYNDGTTVTITGSEISGNSINASESGGANAYGAGVFTYQNSETIITNTTISGNTITATDDGQGGGSYAYDATAEVTLTHVTVAKNAAQFGGGIFGNHTLEHSIIADNTVSGTPATDADCYGSITSTTGYNSIETIESNCTGTVLTDTTNSLEGTSNLSTTLTINSGLNWHTFSDAASSDAVNAIPASNCVAALGSSPVDVAGNARVGHCDAGAFEYQDTVNPVLSVTNGSTTTVECAAVYSDAGATATDDIDESRPVTTVTNTVNTDIVGEYTVGYEAADLTLNEVTGTRTVSVSDTTNPTVLLTGDSAIELTVGDTYSEPGYSASDSCDDTLTVNVTNEVDTTTVGEYTLSYSTTDDSGNTGNATRTITVIENVPPTENDEEGGVVITSVEKQGANLIVTYDNETTETITPFGSSNKFEYALSQDSSRLLATNGKVIKVYVSGDKVTQKKVNKRKPKKTRYYAIKTGQLYSSYETIAFVSASSNKGKLVIFRLTNANELKKKVAKQSDITKRNVVKVKLAAPKKRITATFGKGAAKVKDVWKLKRDGKLKRI